MNGEKVDKFLEIKKHTGLYVRKVVVPYGEERKAYKDHSAR